MRKKNKKQKKQDTYEDLYPEQDENFYYIAGYTPGGAPYGITWEEARRDGLLEQAKNEVIHSYTIQ